MTEVSELIGAALDAAVAKALGLRARKPQPFRPSTDWSQGGPIIEREIIDIECIMSTVGPNAAGAVWLATTKGFDPQSGPTPLIAAMRAFVASKQ